jgi:PAS domain S-box-containing protein
VTDESDPGGGEFATLLQEDLADLYQNAPCGYLSTDADGVILKVNDTFLALTGHKQERLLGRQRFLDLLTPGGRIFYETHFRPLLRMQGSVREIALDVLRADGGRLPVIANAAERRDADGRAVIRITLFDATDRRRYERELLVERQRAEAASSARNELIAMISHDVRAPLSAIVTAAAMLEKSGVTPQQARYLRVLQSSAAHALSLLNSTLDLSSLEAGHARRHERVFNPRQLADHAAEAARLAAAQKPDLAIAVEVDEEIPDRVFGDPDKILQVLINLLGNAVKFTERGRVSLVVAPRALTPDSATLEFVVSDTGIGIAADRLPHIFDDFTQASADIGAKYGGTGLGLAISRRLLRLYGSELQVTSTPGEGTTFSFVLQLTRPADGGG